MWPKAPTGNYSEFCVRSYLCLLLVLELVHSSCLVSAFCNANREHLDTSLWNQFLNQSVFVPISRPEAMRSVLAQTDELLQVIRYFRERYVRRVFQTSDVDAHDSLFSELKFAWLLPPTDLVWTHQNNIPAALQTFQTMGNYSAFLTAYSTFQKMSVGLELVTKDLQHNNEYPEKLGRFWRLAQLTSNRIVESVFVFLRSSGVSVSGQARVARSVVPRRIRCLRQESRRDVRDWVILKSALAAANFYKKVFLTWGGRHFSQDIFST